MPSSMPRKINKYCKVCFERTGKKYFGEKLGNSVKCPNPNCGREIPVSGSRSSNHPFSSMDPVKFRTRGSGMGSAQGSEQDGLDDWKAPTPIRKPGRKIPRQSVGKFPLEPDFDPPYDNEKEYKIIGILPYIKNLEELNCEVINGMLTIEGLKDNFEFFKEFKLPEDVLISSLKVTLNNGILEIHFRKKKKDE